MRCSDLRSEQRALLRCGRVWRGWGEGRVGHRCYCCYARCGREINILCLVCYEVRGGGGAGDVGVRAMCLFGVLFVEVFKMMLLCCCG